MKKGVILGLGIFALGLLVIIIYGLIQGFNDIVGAMDLITGLATGLIMVGLIVLFISVLIEQQKGKKEMNEKIKKEDLEP
jgi:fucose permease